MYKRTGLQLWANPQMLWEVIVSSRGQELRLQDPQDQFCLACLPYVLSRKEEASQLTHHFKKSSPLVPQDIPWSDAISYLSLSTQPLPLCPQEPTGFHLSTAQHPLSPLGLFPPHWCSRVTSLYWHLFPCSPCRGRCLLAHTPVGLQGLEGNRWPLIPCCLQSFLPFF